MIDLKRKIETLKNETYNTSDKKLVLQLKGEKDKLSEDVIYLKKEINFLNNQLKVFIFFFVVIIKYKIIF